MCSQSHWSVVLGGSGVGLASELVLKVANTSISRRRDAAHQCQPFPRNGGDYLTLGGG